MLTRLLRSPFLFPAAFAALLALTSCSNAEPEKSYPDSLHAARIAKDNMLRSAPDSPVPADKRDTILPLQYFPADLSYRVPASLQPPAGPSPAAEMPTSTGQRRSMQVMGTLEFALKGQRLKLTAFAEEGSNGQRLFVPFADATSGHETYAGGRYLDLDRTGTGIYVIDFNTAYNPYCAYNATYDCPVPPPGNRLPVEVRAGEKLPRDHQTSAGK